jgi:hypothetical protein
MVFFKPWCRQDIATSSHAVIFGLDDMVEKEPDTFGSADKYSCFGAAGVPEIQYFSGRISFRQPQTGGS